MAAVALALFGSGLLAGRAQDTPATPPRNAAPAANASVSPAPVASVEAATPTPAAQALSGRGPFVLYTVEEFGAVDLYAQEMEVPKSTPIFLQRLPGKPHDDQATPASGGTGALIDLQEGLIVFVERGAKPAVLPMDDADLGADHEQFAGIVAFAVSPDGKNVAVAVREGDVKIFLYDTHRMGKPRKLATMSTASDDQGGGFSLSWALPTEIIVADACHCDGGPGYTRLSRVSVRTGKVTEWEFLADHDPWGFGTQTGGAAIVFDDTPPVDCWEEPNPCENLLHTLTIADLKRNTLRSVASRRVDGFGWPKISPRGTRIASIGRRSTEIEIYDTAKRKRIATTVAEGAVFSPRAWLDENRLIASVWSPDHTGQGRHTASLLLVDLTNLADTYVDPPPIATGVNLTYAGWIR